MNKHRDIARRLEQLSIKIDRLADELSEAAHEMENLWLEIDAQQGEKTGSGAGHLPLR